MASLGCNLVGDKIYEKAKKSHISGIDVGLKDFINTFPRHALHAKSLGFVHPRTHEFMQFDSNLPDDLQNLAKRLGLN